MEALRQRSELLAPILARLHALDAEGILECPLPGVLSALAHIAVNRLLRRSGDIEEARVHHALVRAYEAELRRAPRSVRGTALKSQKCTPRGRGGLCERHCGDRGGDCRLPRRVGPRPRRNGHRDPARTREGGVCALKVLSKELVGEDPAFATRFKREVQYAEALNHPHVLEVYDSGDTPDGSLFFAMQYVDGPDLSELLRATVPLSLAQAVTILGQIADALDAAHASGLVHRDVNPRNIIVASDPSGPHAYLTDFGLGKHRQQDSIALTRAGQMVGTLPYAAPEEILAQERDYRVDVYSLGCVLYQALVGAPPFVRERDIDVLYAHIGDPRPSASEARPDLPPGIDEVIAKAMAISAAERYASCGELMGAARAVLADAPPATPAGQLAATGEPAATSRPAAADDVAAERGEAPPGALRLTARSGYGSGRELVVEDELVLGRVGILDDVLAPDHSISRRHARISRAPDGFAISDERSRNGTFVNGERVEKGNAPTPTGDEITVGGTVFVVELVDASPNFSPQSRAEPVVAGEAPTRVALRLELDLDAAPADGHVRERPDGTHRARWRRLASGNAVNAGAPAADGARGGLDELLAAAIVIVDGRELTGRDVLAAGVVSGSWQRLERDLSEGLGLVAADPPPDDEVDTRFRELPHHARSFERRGRASMDAAAGARARCRQGRFGARGRRSARRRGAAGYGRRGRRSPPGRSDLHRRAPEHRFRARGSDALGRDERRGGQPHPT